MRQKSLIVNRLNSEKSQYLVSSKKADSQKFMKIDENFMKRVDSFKYLQ